MLTTFESYCTDKLAEIRPNSTFLTVHGYVNEFDELSDFSVGFHIDYHAAIGRSLKILKAFKSSFKFCEGRDFSIRHVDAAREELIWSFEQSLTGHNPLYTCAGVYDRIVGEDGKAIPGIKLHRRQDVLHIEGYRLNKRIYRNGKYPPDNRQQLTKAKDALRDLTPVGKWGQFKLVPRKFDRFVVEKITVTNREVFRQTWAG